LSARRTLTDIFLERFSVQRKMAIVARLLRGEPLELVARETKRLGPFPSTPEAAPTPVLGERSGAPSDLRPSSFVIAERFIRTLKDATGDARERPARAASRWTHRDQATRWDDHHQQSQ
jgi:hypothetical protein